VKKIILIAIIATGFLSAAEQSGEELFKAKCAVCHKMGNPQTMDKTKMVAPALVGVATHLQQVFKTKEERVKHIKEFVVNPTKEKAICPSVKKFGLMPSQKGNVTEEELAKIAEFMAEQKGMNQAVHNKMQSMEKKEKMFKMMDANGDGVVSKEEFEQFREKRMQMQKGNGMNKQQGKGCAK